MDWGEYSLEAHLNLTAQGTPTRDGTSLPTAQQTHLTLEPTMGLSPNFAVGMMFLSAWEPGVYAPIRRLASIAACLPPGIVGSSGADGIRGRVLVSEHPL